jgi:hypothetical protein
MEREINWIDTFLNEVNLNKIILEILQRIILTSPKNTLRIIINEINMILTLKINI